MKNIYVYCEGQTEEAFVNEIICPYLLNCDVYAQPIICSTKRTPTKKYRGGSVNYDKIKSELTIICKMHKNEMVTTLFDYYGMPENTPMIHCNEPDLYQRIQTIEKAIESDIGQPNLIFNFLIHEFEGLLFSDPSAFQLIADDHVVGRIQKMKDEALSPEHINNSVDTAPSKRILSLIPDYAKEKNGTLLSKNIGIDTMMDQCVHFKNWIEKMKNI